MPTDDPSHIPEPPPRGVRRLVASVTCGRPGHPRVILRAATLDELSTAEQDYRCTVCGRPSAGDRPW